MKKVLIVLLSAMMWFNTLTVNVFATTNEETIVDNEETTEVVEEAPQSGDVSGSETDDSTEEEIIIENDEGETTPEIIEDIPGEEDDTKGTDAELPGETEIGSEIKELETTNEEIEITTVPDTEETPYFDEEIGVEVSVSEVFETLGISSTYTSNLAKATGAFFNQRKFIIKVNNDTIYSSTSTVNVGDGENLTYQVQKSTGSGVNWNYTNVTDAGASGTYNAYRYSTVKYDDSVLKVTQGENTIANGAKAYTNDGDVTASYLGTSGNYLDYIISDGKNTKTNTSFTKTLNNKETNFTVDITLKNSAVSFSPAALADITPNYVSSTNKISFTITPKKNNGYYVKSLKINSNPVSITYNAGSVTTDEFDLDTLVAGLNGNPIVVEAEMEQFFTIKTTPYSLDWTDSLNGDDVTNKDIINAIYSTTLDDSVINSDAINLEYYVLWLVKDIWGNPHTYEPETEAGHFFAKTNGTDINEVTTRNSDKVRFSYDPSKDTVNNGKYPAFSSNELEINFNKYGIVNYGENISVTKGEGVAVNDGDKVYASEGNITVSIESDETGDYLDYLIKEGNEIKTVNESYVGSVGSKTVNFSIDYQLNKNNILFNNDKADLKTYYDDGAVAFEITPKQTDANANKGYYVDSIEIDGKPLSIEYSHKNSTYGIATVGLNFEDLISGKTAGEPIIVTAEIKCPFAKKEAPYELNWSNALRGSDLDNTDIVNIIYNTDLSSNVINSGAINVEYVSYGTNTWRGLSNTPTDKNAHYFGRTKGIIFENTNVSETEKVRFSYIPSNDGVNKNKYTAYSSEELIINLVVYADLSKVIVTPNEDMKSSSVRIVDGKIRVSFEPKDGKYVNGITKDGEPVEVNYSNGIGYYDIEIPDPFNEDITMAATFADEFSLKSEDDMILAWKATDAIDSTNKEKFEEEIFKTIVTMIPGFDYGSIMNNDAFTIEYYYSTYHVGWTDYTNVTVPIDNQDTSATAHKFGDNQKEEIIYIKYDASKDSINDKYSSFVIGVDKDGNPSRANSPVIKLEDPLVTIIPVDHATITRSAEGKDNIRITVTPEAGYYVEDILIDGKGINENEEEINEEVSKLEETLNSEGEEESSINYREGVATIVIDVPETMIEVTATVKSEYELKTPFEIDYVYGMDEKLTTATFIDKVFDEKLSTEYGSYDSEYLSYEGVNVLGVTVGAIWRDLDYEPSLLEVLEHEFGIERNKVTSRDTETVRIVFTPNDDEIGNKYTKFTIEKPIKVVDNRIATALAVNGSLLTNTIYVSYNVDKATLYDEIVNSITINSVDDTGKVTGDVTAVIREYAASKGKSLLDYLVINPEIEDSSLIVPYTVSISFKGNADYKDCTNENVKIYVLRANSKIDINISDKSKYHDGIPTVVTTTTTPDGVASLYIVAGIENDLQGYVSINVDTEKMVYRIPSTSEAFDSFLRLITSNEQIAALLPEELRALIASYIEGKGTIDVIGDEIIDFIRRFDPDFDPSKYSSGISPLRILAGAIIRIVAPNLADLYDPIKGEFNYGNLIVNSIKKAIELKDTFDLSQTIESLETIFKALGMENDQLTPILDVVQQAIESIRKADRTNIYVNDEEHKNPKNSGLYMVSAGTLDRNYRISVDFDSFVINPHFDGSITWNETLGNKLIGNVYHLTVREFEDVKSEDLPVKFAATYNVPEGYKGNPEDPEHISDITPKYLYFGGEITTEEEIKNIIDAIQNVESLEDINEIIETYNNIYVGDDITKINLAAGGIYAEVAYVYGNYIEAAARLFTIERVDTKINLSDIKVTYAGKDETKKVILEAQNTETNNVVIDKDTKEVIKDAQDKIVRPEVYYVGLQTNGKFVAPSKDVPTNAGRYLMFARFAGTKFYKGSNIFEDEAKDIIEVMSTININNFEEKIKELGLPILTIERKDVTISWSEHAKEVGNVDLLNVLHYTYNGEALDTYYTVDGLVDGDAVELNVTGDNKDAGYHTMLFTLSGDSAANYDINTTILSTNTLTYEVEKRQLTITWDADNANNIHGTIGKDLLGKDLLTYEYQGVKPNANYIALGNIVEGDDVSPRIISGATDDACQTLLNHELLVGLTGLDSKNYYLTDLLVLDLDYKILPYRITPRPIKVSWKTPIEEVDDYTISEDDVLTYIYNGDINYLTDHSGNNKFNVAYDYETGKLPEGEVSAILPGDDAYVDISDGQEIHVGKYNAEFSLFGRNDSKNYKIVNTKLPYEITPKHISVVYNEHQRNVDENGIIHYTYNGERQYPNNNMLTLVDALEKDRVYPVIKLNISNIRTIYNSINANANPRSLDIALIGASAGDYVLDEPTIKYIIDQRPVYVEWIKTAFNYDGHSKSPLYEIVNIIQKDRNRTSIELSYNVYGKHKSFDDAPNKINTYVATVTGINNPNYKLINPFFYDSKVIFNIDDTNTVAGRKITIGSVSSKDLRDKGVTATFNNIPDMSQGIDLLKNLTDKRLLNNFLDSRRYRMLHLNLESDYVNIYSKPYSKKLAIAEDRLGKDIVKRAFFFDLDLYADVTGVIDKAKVHNTNSDYQVNVKMTFNKDSEVVKNIIGNNKNYYVIRIHNGKLEFLDVTVTSDETNYYFSFKSDKFSTYGIYSVDKPVSKKYNLPKTGVQ